MSPSSHPTASECRWLCWWPLCWAKFVPSMRTKRTGKSWWQVCLGGPEGVKPIISQYIPIWNDLLTIFVINCQWGEFLILVWSLPFVYFWTRILQFCCGPPVTQRVGSTYNPIDMCSQHWVAAIRFGSVTSGFLRFTTALRSQDCYLLGTNKNHHSYYPSITGVQPKV